MPPLSQRYAVYGPDGDDPLVIDAENWVFALGTALELLEREDWVSRLACEVHPDGTVVAQDRVTGASYLVHKVPIQPGRRGPQAAGAVDGAVDVAVDGAVAEALPPADADTLVSAGPDTD